MKEKTQELHQSENPLDALLTATDRIANVMQPEAFILAVKDQNDNTAVVVGEDAAATAFLLIKTVEQLAGLVGIRPDECFDDLKQFYLDAMAIQDAQPENIHYH